MFETIVVQIGKIINERQQGLKYVNYIAQSEEKIETLIESLSSNISEMRKIVQDRIWSVSKSARPEN
jgi:hypothetical protein